MVRSVFNGAGYLRSDNRCSGGDLDEADVVGCSHCQKIMKKTGWKADGGFCHRCDAPVCGLCCDRIPLHGCEVFMRVLETALAKKYRLEQNARLMGLDLNERTG